MKNNKRQRGYTMVLFLAFIAAILLAGFSLYDNGIVATERIRIQNTTDATAYSTMTVLSRDMNFIAYTNRGMVGNQVAIAQMVGLSSWMNMIHQTAYNLDALAKLTYAFPPVGAVVNKATGLIKKVAKSGKVGIKKMAQVAIPIADGLNVGLSHGQKIFQLATADMAKATFNEVAKANDKDIKVGLLNNALALGTAVKSWKKEVNYNEDTSTKKSNKKELKRFSEFAGVVNDSRDPFSAQRSYDWIGLSTIVDLGISYVKVSLEKKGGTDFIKTKTKKNAIQWHWTAMDTAGFWLHLKWPHKLHTHKSSTEILPVGWGAAHALNNQSKSKTNFNYSNYKNKKQLTYYDKGLHNSANRRNGYKHWGNGAWKNSISASIASYDDANNNLAKTSGINNFYTLKSDNQKDTGPNIVAMLTKPRKKLRVQQTLDSESTSYNRSNRMKIEEKGSIAGNSLYGLSKAETYFSRPRDLWPRGDKMREYGNLYNPFWQTRLVVNNKKEQLLAAAIQAVN